MWNDLFNIKIPLFLLPKDVRADLKRRCEVTGSASRRVVIELPFIPYNFSFTVRLTKINNRTQ